MRQPDDHDSQEHAAYIAEQREVFRRMEQEQREDYEDYVRRCEGVPISTVKP